MTEIDDPRYRKLLIEWEGLTRLAMSSLFIRVEPVEAQPGWPPDEYVITYTCKGIVGIDEYQNPIYGEHHQVGVRFSEHYPMQEPELKWLTPIWHPNIVHREPRRVCTNAPDSWWPAKSFVEVVKFMGEMVQYKRYHAKLVKPEPADLAVAAWVRDFAEPNGIVGPDRAVDPRPLVRPSLYTAGAEPEPPTKPEPPAPRKRAGIEFGELVPVTEQPSRVIEGQTLGGAGRPRRPGGARE